MNLKLRTPWDVVNEWGQSALRLLKIALDSESELTRNTANMEAFAVGADGYLALVARNEILGRDIFRVCSASIVMFQTMLDAAMADTLRLDSRLADISPDSPFDAQWEPALTKFGTDTDTLAAYTTDIYKKYWMPITHLTRNGIGVFGQLAPAAILQGYANGWDAYAKLAHGIGKPLQDDSWPTALRDHGLPESA
jgi:hypothetical protein